MVYLAKHKAIGTTVAIKVLRDELARSTSADRFLREIRLTARLEHPAIVSLLDSGDDGQRLYIVMPFMDGGSLRERLQHEKQLPIADAVRLTSAVAEALEYAHRHGIIHRDIKPENILFSGDRVCLADFGVARALESVSGFPTTSSGVVPGTPAYMSPEQASGERAIDGRSDIYSLACVLYEMLAGVPAFVGPSSQSVLAQRMTHSPRDVRIYRPLVSTEIAAVIDKAFQPVPADRYQSAGEFARELTAAASRPITTTAAAGVAMPSRKTRRPVIAVASAMAAIVAAVTVLTRVLDRATGSAALDSSHLAVAPFDVIGMPSAEWRYGLVDVLARNFDGAGPLVSVPASFVIARWSPSDRADRASAQRLAERTGAGLVIFGQLVFYDSTRLQLRANIYDAVAQRIVAEPDLTATDPSRVVHLADSLTTLTLDVLAKSRAIAAVNRVSVAWPKLEALKAYLRGEQYLRRNKYPEALREYQTSIHADPSFALPYRGARRSLRVIKSEFDSTSLAYALEAGARNRNLTSRDSLLIVADSLVASCGFRFMFVYDRTCEQRLARQVTALETAARRYPDDPEVFEELGEARVHLGTFVGQTAHGALDAFTRAIASDPGYAPPYFHAVELAGLLGGDSSAHIVSGYLRQFPTDSRYQLIAKALAAASRGRILDAPTLQAAKVDDVMDAAFVLRRWPGALHPADRLRRFVAGSAGVDEDTQRDARLSLFVNLLFHGQLHEARSILGSIDAARVPLEVATLAELDRSAEDDMRSLISAAAVRTGTRGLLGIVPWWATIGDTAALNGAASRFQPIASSTTAPDREAARYGMRLVAFYRALAAHDTVAAMREGRTLAGTPCALYCTPALLKVSTLLRMHGQGDSAAVLLDAHPPFAAAFSAVEVLWRFERATIASELLGRPLDEKARARELGAARENYLFVVNAWCAADSVLQPVSRQAREQLRRISAITRPSC